MQNQNYESRGEVAIAVIGEYQARVRRARIVGTILLSALVIVLALIL